MRCHYVVMGLEKASTADDIKKTYRKLAIKLHPDKNLGNSDAAAELFKELAAAYECLSDPRERKWYDEHRIEILRGDDPDSDSSSDSDGDVAGKRGKTKLKKREVNLWPYFSSACYEGFDSDSGDSSFYAVYARAFAAVDGAEGDGWVAAPFGDGWAAWDVVKRFYDTYGDFQSTRTFASYDKWHVGGEESRYVRRAAEAENKKERRGARAAYQDMVRSLAAHCRKRDPRVKRQSEEDAAKKKVKEAKDAALKAQKVQDHAAAKRAWLAAQAETETSYEVRPGALVDESDESSADGEVRVLACEVCNKIFKSERQFENHWQSKAHKKKMGSLAYPKSFDDSFFSAHRAENEIQLDDAPAADDDDEPQRREEPADDESDTSSSDDEVATSAAADEDATSADDESSASDDVAPVPATKKKKKKKAVAAVDDATSSSSEDDGERRPPPPPVDAPAAAPAAAAASDDDDLPSAPGAAKKKSRRKKKEKEAPSATAPPPAAAAGPKKVVNNGKIKKKAGNSRRRGDSTDEDDLACAKCSQRFASKTKLMGHLKQNPGHAKLKA